MNTNELKKGHASIVQGIEKIYDSISRQTFTTGNQTLPIHHYNSTDSRARAVVPRSTATSDHNNSAVGIQEHQSNGAQEAGDPARTQVPSISKDDPSAAGNSQAIQPNIKPGGARAATPPSDTSAVDSQEQESNRPLGVKVTTTTQDSPPAPRHPPASTNGPIIQTGTDSNSIPAKEILDQRLRFMIQQRLDTPDSQLLKEVLLMLTGGANPKPCFAMEIKAVEMADIPLLKLLLKNSIRVSRMRAQTSISQGAKNVDPSLLLVACGQGFHFPTFSANVVKLLLDYGSDVNIKTPNGWMPLMYIC